jgi:alpha-tubulin suppressor-like RCC1 family protein
MAIAAACGLIGLAGAGETPAPAEVAVGPTHGVMLKADGSLWTWGDNGLGQLGVPGDHAWTPTRVPGLGPIKAAAAGDRFTVAVDEAGEVWFWGADPDGQLGGGAKASPKPVRMAGLSGVISLAAAGDHGLALGADGRVWAFGEDAAPGASPAPRPVAGLTDVVAVAASEKHSVALKADGSVWVWGDHGAGDLGNGFHGTTAAPAPLRGLSDIVAVAAGYQLTLALKKDGAVWAVGYGAAGGLGNGSAQDSNTPVRVRGLTGVKAIAAGYMHALALKSDGTVWSWGYNHDGQLGAARFSAEQSVTPIHTDKLTDAVAIAAAGNHSAAVTRQGVVWAWGENDAGVLGADPEVMARSDAPARVGQSVPGQCQALFTCSTDRGKVIRICGDQDPDDVSRWTGVQYRYGPEDGPPEFVFPKTPTSRRSPLYFSHEDRRGDYRVSVRFTNGAFGYRVYSGSKSGAGVEVTDASGKRISDIACNESPEMFAEYLRLSLPCDLQNPHGAAACREAPYAGR